MNKGFTLMELLIVVIVVAILAAIGLPMYFNLAERARASEGINMLGALRNSQARYALEHGNTTSSEADLDITVPDLRYFNKPASYLKEIAPDNHLIVAELKRNNKDNSGYGNYELKIYIDDGNITCGNGLKSICDVLGY